MDIGLATFLVGDGIHPAVLARETEARGFGSLMLTEHDPIVLAKQVSSLDRLSGGRFLFGVGPGWNEREMRNRGTDPAHRFRVLRERVEAMRAIWTNDEDEFHGRDVDFDPIWQWPKPLQQPLPVLIGGNGPKAEDRVLRYGDGKSNVAGRSKARSRACAGLRPRRPATGGETLCQRTLEPRSTERFEPARYPH